MLHLQCPTPNYYKRTYSGCLISLIARFRDILSLANPLNPLTLYRAAFCSASEGDNSTAVPCSPGPVSIQHIVIWVSKGPVLSYEGTQVYDGINQSEYNVTLYEYAGVRKTCVSEL